MPPGLLCLHNVDANSIEIPRDQLVDIVAVHGLYEDSVEAWTDPDSGINWLRDLLPKYVPTARILAYGYDAPLSSFSGPNASLYIQRMAEGLVSALCADRRLSGMRQCPIIFVCHGLGGVIVKKSLIYSETRTAPKVDHLWDPFVSTFAILFFGTPHAHTLKSSWLALRTNLRSKIELETCDIKHLNDAAEELQALQSIAVEFAPIMNQFHMFFFWEELRSSFGTRSDFIVDRASAVLEIDNTEKTGIHATHSQMVKFSSPASSNFRTIVEALSRYCQDAPRIISHRWQQAIPTLNQLRASEAFELGGLGFDVRSELPFRHEDPQGSKLKTSYFEVPQEATQDFIGRDEKFRVLNRAFLPGGNLNLAFKLKSFVVYGLGGTGKTEFCSKFARDNQYHYSAVFTIRAANTETIKSSFCNIGAYGGLESTENAGRHFLSQLKEPWLLIIDNADDPALDLKSIFPSCNSAHILVTTRNPDFRQLGSLGFLELSGLEKEEALQLLLTRAEIPKPWDSSIRQTGSAITKALGYLALALVHAGTCICKRVCKLGEYLSHHSSSRHHIQHRRVSTSNGSDYNNDEDDDVVKTVYSAFDVSLNFISRKHTIRSQDTLELLRIICFYHFEHIPVELFDRSILNGRKAMQNATIDSFGSRLWNATMKRFEPPKNLPRFLNTNEGQLDKYRVTWAISELQSLSLIAYDGRDSTFSLHPLVHAWARDSLSVCDRKIWASVALNTLFQSFLLPPDGSPENDGEFHGQILPHLEACLSEYGKPLTESIDLISNFRLKVTLVFSPTFRFIMRDQIVNTAKCGYIFAARGRFKESTIYLEAVKHSLMRSAGNKNEKTIFAMLALARVYWGLGRLEEAIELQKNVVRTRLKINGPQHADTLQAMDQLGQSYWLHGQYQESLSLQQLTTERMKATMGSDDLKTLAALDNLGVTLGAWHRFEESISIHRQVLIARRKLLGEDHLDTLTTMNNHAMALLDLGRLDEAKSEMTKVYEERKRQLGKEHPWTLWALCYLAKINIELGALSEAEEMLTWGIAAGERSLSKDHLGVLMGRGELGRVYARQGKLDIAEKLSVETIDLIEKSRGAAHPDCVYGLWKLTQLYQLKDDKAKAIKTCERALVNADMRIGRSHPLTQKLEDLLRNLQDGASNGLDDKTSHSKEPETQPIRRLKVHHLRTW